MKTPDICNRPRQKKSLTAFTLIELIVVIAIVAILSATALPAISRAKPRSKTARCASNMRVWGMATSMYLSDNKDCLPYFGNSSHDYTQRFWSDSLAPYVARMAEPGTWFSSQSPGYSMGTEIFTNEVRRCPAGNYSSGGIGAWSTWIGANFGAYGNAPLSGPFYYGDYNPPLNITRIRKPADAMAFMDTVSHYVYSPADTNCRFTLDYDGDGTLDTMAQYPSVPYNYARPKVHENGANVTLLDGHVERVPFKDLWRVDRFGKVTHSFWYLED